MGLLNKAENAIYIYTHGYLDILNTERQNVIIGKNSITRVRTIFQK